MADAMRQVILTPDREDGGWVVEVPSLPGCVSYGKSKPEALRNVRDAIGGWLSVARDHGDSIPDDDFSCAIVVIDEPVVAESA